MNIAMVIKVSVIANEIAIPISFINVISIIPSIMSSMPQSITIVVNAFL